MARRDYSGRKSRAREPDEATIQSREEAVQALLLNPELSLRRLKDEFKLSLSVSTLAKYRQRLNDGKEPWLAGPGGGRPTSGKAATTAARSAAARAAVHTQNVADGLTSLLPMAEADSDVGEDTPEAPAAQSVQSAPPAPPPNFQQPSQAGKPAVAAVPLSVANRAAVARAKALEGVNSLAAAVAMKSLKRISDALDQPGTRVSVKELAIISGISIDRFLTTAASLEGLTGQSGVPGALDHFKGNQKDYGDKRIRSETELKRLLRVVRWRDDESATAEPAPVKVDAAKAQ